MNLKLLKTGIYLLVLFYSSQVLSQTIICDTLLISPEKGKDAYVNSHYSVADTNFGNSEEFEAQAWTAGGDSFVVRSFIDFEFQYLPLNANIISASLFLYHKPGQSHSTLSGSNACYLERIISPWQESTVTWNNQPNTTNINSSQIPATTSATQDFPNIDITNLVIDIQNNLDSSYGIAIKLQTEVEYRQMYFSSGDSQDENKRPFVIICYDVPNNISDQNASENSDLFVFPNPCQGKFTINRNDMKYAEVYNLNGALIKTTNTKEVDLSENAKGLYIVKVISEKEIETVKLLVE